MSHRGIVSKTFLSVSVIHTSLSSLQGGLKGAFRGLGLGGFHPVPGTNLCGGPLLGEKKSDPLALQIKNSAKGSDFFSVKSTLKSQFYENRSFSDLVNNGPKGGILHLYFVPSSFVPRQNTTLSDLVNNGPY